MDAQQVIALARAMAEVPGPPPLSGVIHIVVPHTRRFTVVGNHLAQHKGLSLVAIGLAVHIQSLPTGAKVGIKVLVERFPESEARIASGLRELETHDYLRRTRCRLTNGRLVTRTVFHNQPGAVPHQPAATPPAPAPRPRPGEPPAPPEPPTLTTVPDVPAPAPPVPLPVLPPVPAPTAPKPSLPPLPTPHTPTPELHRAAAALLADLRRHAPQVLLTEGDIHSLAPGVATWLERDVHPDTIRDTLTSDLPHPLKHPAKLLKHRLTALVPPPLPGAPDHAPVRRRTIPLQNCDNCDRAFRSTEPGHCRDCRAASQARSTHYLELTA